MSRSRILNTQKLFAGKTFEVITDRVVEPNGRIVVRDVVRHSPAVVIFPLLSKSEILLIRQYRYATDEFLWELPAGSVESGETIPQAGLRELEEETGYKAASISELFSFYSAPGFTDEKMHVILASSLTKTAPRPDDDENIEIHIISLEKVYAMLFGGVIIDAKSIASLLLVRSKLNL
ncbi:MAG: NUDIX hydrolase [Acidobacteriia bacterium]|nr:NUDIX hydrolase [Terriglobia bacterium]